MISMGCSGPAKYKRRPGIVGTGGTTQDWAPYCLRKYWKLKTRSQILEIEDPFASA
jgi:hypothetical protein